MTSNYLAGIAFCSLYGVVATVLWIRGIAPWWFALGIWAAVAITSLIFSVHLR